MRTLKDVIDYDTAPLVQWEPVIGEEPSEGKKIEDALTHGAVAKELIKQNAKRVTGIIADEARMELYIANHVPSINNIHHLTLTGAFEKAAQHNVDNAVQNKAPKASHIDVTTDIDSISPHSQDAVVMNMILGCLACTNAHENLTNMLKFASSLLKPNGSLILVRPNPEGGKFSTYECVTAANDLKAGEDYDFVVKGLEAEGAMKNLYTPDNFLKTEMKKAGLKMRKTTPINDVSSNNQTVSKNAAFLINVCKPL